MNLVVETKLFNLSTCGSACKILNNNKQFKSKCEYNVPNMIEREKLFNLSTYGSACKILNNNKKFKSKCE